jgi:predicted transcriptional regulator
MKTAISIPDDVFADAERLAKELKASRSQLYARAVREFVLRHSPDQVTADLDDVCECIGPADDGFATTVARGRLKRSEW